MLYSHLLPFFYILYVALACMPRGIYILWLCSFWQRKFFIYHLARVWLFEIIHNCKLQYLLLVHTKQFFQLIRNKIIDKENKNVFFSIKTLTKLDWGLCDSVYYIVCSIEGPYLTQKLGDCLRYVKLRCLRNLWP